MQEWNRTEDDNARISELDSTVEGQYKKLKAVGQYLQDAQYSMKDNARTHSSKYDNTRHPLFYHFYVGQWARSSTVSRTMLFALSSKLVSAVSPELCVELCNRESFYFWLLNSIQSYYLDSDHLSDDSILGQQQVCNTHRESTSFFITKKEKYNYYFLCFLLINPY